jgi:hypothetical protein
MTESPNFRNPSEELNYLRAKVLEAEKQLESAGVHQERDVVIRDSIRDFGKESIPTLPQERRAHVDAEAEKLLEQHKVVELEEMMRTAENKGVLHVLQILEKMKGWRFEDDFHDYLVSHVAKGIPVRGVKLGSPEYRAVHMTLFEIILPRTKEEGNSSLSELILSMEQLYAGLLSLSGTKDKRDYLTFEIANPEGVEDTHIFASVPNAHKDLFSKQLLAIFPSARLVERKNDYNMFSELGVTIGAVASLTTSPGYPLKTFEQFGDDPLNVILNGFSKMPAIGTGAALQIIFRPVGDKYTKKYQGAIKKIEKGEAPDHALQVGGRVLKLMNGIEGLFSYSKKKGAEDTKPKEVDTKAVEFVSKKLESPIVETNIRMAVSAQTEEMAEQLMHNFQSAFNQFDSPGRQSIKWREVRSTGWMTKESKFYRSFIFRLFKDEEVVPLNLKELSTLLHFQTEALSTSSTLAQSKSRSAPVPTGLRDEGTLLGINAFQGLEKKIYLAPEDRLRHFYAIGQTGTGKSTLLKNMIVDDIRKGQGVCMIDPHGSDLIDVLSKIPKDRIDDVIYFDPANTERPMSLNMLEYDPKFPEQKTFVVNELFSIFQKLYGGTPESMGPMFEQYFRNATMLVIEDPESGSTLLDVSRVMSDKEYRDLKISRCKNPVVVQFWREIAEKAGGEGALANMVPYITSKFDVFLSNDIMRPIIAQEKSSFNFREIMDNKKILLVNLSKGRLGEINASLIGLIIVGKILMAALSRVDSTGKDLPPFYLYIDEFQNITTNSIAIILSEARKYKLSLNIAHQFIAQLQDDIKNAVFGNVGTICTFRVGQDDAEYLERQFAPNFSAQDIASIDNFNAYIKMLVGGRPVEPFDLRLMPKEDGNPSQIEPIKDLSSLKYGRNREEVEGLIMRKYQKSPEIVS